MKLYKGRFGLILCLITLIAAYWILFRFPAEVHRERGRGGKTDAGTEEGYPDGTPVLPPPSRDRLPVKKTIAILIDDVGYNPVAVEELLKIDVPLAFAVLPHTPHAAAAAEMIHEKGHEILLHLPMEARAASHDPGPGALLRRMGEAEIRRQVEEDLAAVPHAIGVNNHMGSAFMEDEGKLAVVFKELQARGVFFIDSLTTPTSRGEVVARKTGISFAKRGLFLDNDQNEEKIFANLMNNLEKSNGSPMVIIGHPYPGTLKALRKAVPLLRLRGVLIVPPSELARTNSEEKSTDGNE